MEVHLQQTATVLKRPENRRMRADVYSTMLLRGRKESDPERVLFWKSKDQDDSMQNEEWVSSM